MTSDNTQKRSKEESVTKKPLTKEQAEIINTVSSVAAVAGLSVTVLAALELSVPVMVLAAVAGALSAVSKLFVAKHSAPRVEGTATTSEESEQPQKENNSDVSQ